MRFVELIRLKYLLVSYCNVIARMPWWDVCFFVISFVTNALSVNPLTYGLTSHQMQSHRIWRLMVFIQILIISNDPFIRLLSRLPPLPVAKGRFQHTPSVDEHLTAVVPTSSLWLWSSSDGEGWHFNNSVWLSQCGGQYLPHPHGSRCEGRTLDLEISGSPPLKSNKKGPLHIQPTKPGSAVFRFACGSRSAKRWWTNSFTQGFTWECYWFVVCSSFWQVCHSQCCGSGASLL